MLSSRQTLVPPELVSRRVLLRIRWFLLVVSCQTLASCQLPIAPDRADPLQGTGLTPAWLKHCPSTSLRALLKWKQPGSVPVTALLTPCHPGPSGLPPYRALQCCPTQEERACCPVSQCQRSLGAGDTVYAVLSAPRSFHGLGKVKGMQFMQLGLGGLRMFSPQGRQSPDMLHGGCLLAGAVPERCQGHGKPFEEDLRREPQLWMPHKLRGQAQGSYCGGFPLLGSRKWVPWGDIATQPRMVSQQVSGNLVAGARV